MTDARKHIVLASGGTGGHVFPARALSAELIERGYEVTLMTDDRGEVYEKLFPGVQIKQVKAGSPSMGGIRGKVSALFNLGIGFIQSLKFLYRLKPIAVVGFGGYPSLPPAFAATVLNIPLILHEQNAILGRVNRLLARKSACIATSFPYTDADDAQVISKMTFTGNPVRSEIRSLFGSPYLCAIEADKINLLITGGSQGAAVLSEIVPAAIASLDGELQSRLQVTQQCRAEDLERVRDIYAGTKVTVELATFFEDMPKLLAGCHLAIVRSGASTMAELAIAGRPAILVPYKFAMDDHQFKNAKSAVDRGAAELILQDEFTVPVLMRRLESLFSHPEKLKTMALATANCAEVNAADKLADLVERLANKRNTSSLKSGKVVA